MKNTGLLNACRAVMTSGGSGSSQPGAGPAALGWQLQRAALSADDMNELCERLEEGDALRSAAPQLSDTLREMLREYHAVLSERRRPRDLPRC